MHISFSSLLYGSGLLYLIDNPINWLPLLAIVQSILIFVYKSILISILYLFKQLLGEREPPVMSPVPSCPDKTFVMDDCISDNINQVSFKGLLSSLHYTTFLSSSPDIFSVYDCIVISQGMSKCSLLCLNVCHSAVLTVDFYEKLNKCFFMFSIEYSWGLIILLEQ